MIDGQTVFCGVDIIHIEHTVILNLLWFWMLKNFLNVQEYLLVHFIQVLFEVQYYNINYRQVGQIYFSHFFGQSSLFLQKIVIKDVKLLFTVLCYKIINWLMEAFIVIVNLVNQSTQVQKKLKNYGILRMNL